MARTREYERLAKLKAEEKKLKEEISALQQKILLSEHEHGEKIVTKYGPLQYQEQQSYKILDNHKLIKNSSITQQIFINVAKISASELKKIVGEPEFKTLLRKKIVKQNDPSRFFKLLPISKNQEQE